MMDDVMETLLFFCTFGFLDRTIDTWYFFKFECQFEICQKNDRYKRTEDKPIPLLYKKWHLTKH